MKATHPHAPLLAAPFLVSTPRCPSELLLTCVILHALPSKLKCIVCSGWCWFSSGKHGASCVGAGSHQENMEHFVCCLLYIQQNFLLSTYIATTSTQAPLFTCPPACTLPQPWPPKTLPPASRNLSQLD